MVGSVDGGGGLGSGIGLGGIVFFFVVFLCRCIYIYSCRFRIFYKE